MTDKNSRDFSFFGWRDVPSNKKAPLLVRDQFHSFLMHFSFDYQIPVGVYHCEDLSSFEYYFGVGFPSVKVAFEEFSSSLQIIDLHGMSRINAKSILIDLVEDFIIVYFGKGQGVMRATFWEYFMNNENYLLIGVSGGSKLRPFDAIGLIISKSFSSLLEKKLLLYSETKKERSVSHVSIPSFFRNDAESQIRLLEQYKKKL